MVSLDAERPLHLGVHVTARFMSVFTNLVVPPVWIFFSWPFCIDLLFFFQCFSNWKHCASPHTSSGVSFLGFGSCCSVLSPILSAFFLGHYEGMYEGPNFGPPGLKIPPAPLLSPPLKGSPLLPELPMKTPTFAFSLPPWGIFEKLASFAPGGGGFSTLPSISSLFCPSLSLE